MKLKRLRIGLVSVGAAVVIGLAAQAHSSQSQQEMNQKAWRDLEKADVQLNQTYQKLKKSLETSKQKKLVVAQNAWIKFRASEMEGGSAEPMLNAGYSTRLTKKRTQELQDAYKQFSSH